MYTGVLNKGHSLRFIIKFSKLNEKSVGKRQYVFVYLRNIRVMQTNPFGIHIGLKTKVFKQIKTLYISRPNCSVNVRPDAR